MRQRVLLAGIWEQENSDFERQMDELRGLADACEMEVVDVMVQKLPRMQPASYFGSGRLLEIKERLAESEAEAVVVLHECTPSQLRNLERSLNCRIIDRTQLILQIFERRARTKEARIQVEMAMCQYELPRLMHASDHWSRQAGGRNKGKGEQQLALDKRALQRRITSLKRELAGIQEKKETQRRFRQQSPLKKIALVGYTNAGKSTVLNHLLMLSEQAKEKQVLEQDLLFATLDTNVRLIQVKGHTPFLLSDTVGFLEHLPKPLLAAFDATLKEAQKADLLLHSIDISDPQFAIKREVTIQTLQRIGCAQLPCMEVYNKVDLCSDLQEEKRNDALYISAHSEEGMRQLLTALDAWQWEDSVALSWRFAYDQQRELSSLYTYADIETRMEKENGIYLQGKLPSKRRSQFRGYECEEI